MARKKTEAEAEAPEQEQAPEEQAPDEPTESPESPEETPDDADVPEEEDDVVQDDTEASTEPVAAEPAELPGDVNAEARRRWLDANPGATVIPPSLLPPAYQDGTVITPGMP